ncbi:MAG TPA: AbrB/MazE/SpoVT family DNA-binding domain-containing protein [Novimethylophilus sp.]|uniref:AbrB/MazE/SpoVT family DNA-binding domain-containing protein n=1 Tax=Novimethylophilus sp. TaxID=2137426 RepID=UPI002F3FABC5
MKAVMRKFGNSIGLIIPKPLREELNLQAGQTVSLEITGSGLLMKPSRKKYKLAELLAENAQNAGISEDMSAWENMPAVGKEIL